MIKDLDSIKLYTVQCPDCYFVYKDGRVVYLGNEYSSIRTFALHLMELNVTLEEVNSFKELTST